MNPSDMARYRIEDMVRAGEAHRRMKETRAARASAHRSTARRVVAHAVMALAAPFRH